MGGHKSTGDLRDRAVKKFIDMLVPTFRCPLCGFPLRVSGSIRWRKNGTISPIFIRRYARVVMMPTGLYDRLFSQLHDILGLSIDHILFEAQRNISKSTFDHLERVIPLLKLLKRIPLMQRCAVEGYCKIGIVTGMAYAETIEYIPGDHATKRIVNPYNIHLLTANSTGGLEYLEGCPFQTEVTGEGDDSYLVRFSPIHEKPSVSERLKVEKPVLAPGNIKYEKCRFCHTPRVVSSRFKCIEDEGKILDILSNSRVVMLDGFLVNTVFRELAKELGDEVYEILVSAQRDWTIEHVQLLGMAPGESYLAGSNFEAAFRAYLDDMPVFGYGNPVSLSRSGSSMEVTVENPFQEEIIAGTLQGLYQVFSGKECRTTWKTTGKATVSYSIEPA